MKINNYKELLEYKERLAAKEQVSLNVLNYQWEEKQALWKGLVKKALIPIGIATTGYAVNAALSKWDSGGDDEDTTDESRVSSNKVSHDSYSTAKLVVNLIKIAAPLISAYLSKQQIENNH